MRPTRKILQILALTLIWTASSFASNWPDFRGPLASGHARNPDLPLTWSETENVRWKVSLPGRGYSSPVIFGDQIWTTTALDEERSLRALAIDKESGQVLHNIELFRPESWQASHNENSYASPSPVLEDDRVYIHFGTYGTAAISMEDGQVLWRSQALQLDHEVGPGSSPILFEDLLIVNCDGYDVRYVAALDKNTGDLRWKAPRSIDLSAKKGTHLKAFTTPLLVNHAGQTQLISTGAGQTSAYNPRTGEEIWVVRHEGYSNVSRPVAGLGMVFINSGYIKPHLLAVRLGGRGDITDSHVEWNYHWQVPANPSPLLIGDRLYMTSDWGIASWLDVRQGVDLWRQRLGGKYYASPIHAFGRIYNFSTDGKSVVVAADDTFEELATNQLDGVIRASPGVSGKAFYIRTTTHLYRIEEIEPPNASPGTLP